MSTAYLLRCGRCWRNVANEWGVALHVMFEDGSMRCSAPELHDEPGEYTPTHAVLDSNDRLVKIAEVAPLYAAKVREVSHVGR